MSIWYTVSGKMRLSNTPEMRMNLQELETKLEQLHNVSLKLQGERDLTIAVFSAYGETTASTACDVDDALKALGPFVVEPAKIRTSCDYEDEVFWIGKQSDIDESLRKDKIAEVRALLEGLTPKDRFEAVRGLPIIVVLEDQHDDSEVTAEVEVALRDQIYVQSGNAQGHENGCVAVEIWKNELRSLSWSEATDGGEPEIFTIQEDVEIAKTRVFGENGEPNPPF